MSPIFVVCELTLIRWSAFTASQRLSSSMTKDNRVFLVGDAVHTHSPVTGMGMNTSIQ
jgi:phenol 2-monooxygenase